MTRENYIVLPLQESEVNGFVTKMASVGIRTGVYLAVSTPMTLNTKHLSNPTDGGGKMFPTA